MRLTHLMKLTMLTVLLLCSGLYAGIYYEQEMTLPAQGPMPGGTTKMVCYISGPKVRMDTTVHGLQNIVIQRFDKDVLYTLMPAQKMFMEMQMPKLDPQQEARTQVTVTKTEETKKIGKYTCTRYDVAVDGQAITYWMTADVDLGDELGNLWQAARRLQSTKLAQKLTQIKGFPIVTEAKTPQGNVTVVVSTVKKQDVPDSMFEVPADYQKMPMPAPTAGGPGSKL